MFETVSVDEALLRGKRMLSYPVLAILFIPIIIALALYLALGINGWLVAVVAVLSFALAWLYWSIAITKWRLWAFDNVRNVHELKKRAVKEKLIWEDGSIWGNTEIWSAAQKEQWTAIKSKFKQQDVFQDDLSIPAQLEIYYSKLNATGSLIFGLVFIAGGIYLYFENGKGLPTWLALIVGIGMCIMGYRHLSNRDAQLTLSNDGVQLADKTFYPWADIRDEDTKVVSTGKSSTNYFTFISPDGEKSIEISELDITQSKMDSLLRTYRGRSDKKFLGKGVFN